MLNSNLGQTAIIAAVGYIWAWAPNQASVILYDMPIMLMRRNKIFPPDPTHNFILLYILNIYLITSFIDILLHWSYALFYWLE